MNRTDRPRALADGNPTGTVALRWTATHPENPAGKTGIDILAVLGGRIAEVWSISGDRAI